MRSALGILLVLGLRHVAASGAIEIGPANITFENGHSGNCIEQVTGMCPAAISGGSMGQQTLDARQESVRLRASIDRDSINDFAGFMLLPGGDLTIAPSAYRLPNPAFLILAEEVGTVRGAGPASGFGLTFREGGMGGWYVGPALEPMLPVGQRGFWTPYASDEPGGTRFYAFTNDSILIGEDFGDSSTDARLNEVPVVLTRLSGLSAEPAAQLILTAEETTPNVLFGGGFVAAEASTEAELATRTAWSPQPADGGPLGSRAPVIDLPAARPWQSDSSGPLYHGGAPLNSSIDVPLQRPHENRDLVISRSELDLPRPDPDPPILPLTAAFALAILLAALYSRLKKEDLLQAPHRARILSALDERGPLRLAALARIVGVDRTTVGYHVELLERAELVVPLRAGRWVYIGLPGQPLPASSMAGGELGAAVRDLLALHGGELPRAQLHEFLSGVPQRTRNHALRQLVAAGAVREISTELGTFVSLAR